MDKAARRVLGDRLSRKRRPVFEQRTENADEKKPRNQCAAFPKFWSG
ncbi:hypothetical protein L5014_05160 [Paraburkholderia sp. RG36]|uniref:Uncharacterized protein n=1 Tax=Paraburkholderia tagetis TaxID=2913261 RepID=A0A9X1UGM5_9BURK|nr:hypothetical protein [Paraburkholderia tagetis]